VRRAALAFLAAATALAAVPAEPARATDPLLRPLDLRVEGGETTWHADGDFRLFWDNPRSGDQALAIEAVHFLVRAAGGALVVPEARLPGNRDALGPVAVPPLPGRYEAEIWLEAPGGETGPRVGAALLFDDVRPAAAAPLVPAGWVAGDSVVRLRLEHPAAPQPLSGIRGYAVAVGPGAGTEPCAGPDRCSPAETDVSSGIDGDTVPLGLLAEGTHTVRTVAVSGSGMRSAEASGVIRVDATAPAVDLDAPEGWSDRPVLVTARAGDELSGMAAGGPSGPYTAISVDGGVPRLDLGARVTAPVAGEGVHEVAAYARDGAGNVGGRSSRVSPVRIDETPPALAFARSQDPAEPERIEATVDDPLSGADPAGASIAVRPAGSRLRFQQLPTSLARGRLVAHWDSDAFAPGSYEFRASVRDMAGNGGSTERRGNGARMVLANPLKLTTVVRAGLGVQTRRRPLPYGGRAVYAGRLSSISGTPLAGLPVEVIETFAAGASPAARTTVVRTAADGSFEARLAPGPSRSIAARFAGNRTLSRSQGSGARLPVAAGVRLHASAGAARIGGAPVTFAGRIGKLGAPIPAGGRPVELQFRLPGGSWSEFRTVQSDARGRFRYAYAFSDDDSRGVRFQFRAFVAAEDGWPYEPAGSKPVSVTGR
jgi:hypothetical protein